MKQAILAALILTAALFSACQPVSTDPEARAEAATVTLATHDSFSVSDEVIRNFESDHNVTLRILTLGDAVETVACQVVNQSTCQKNGCRTVDRIDASSPRSS